MGIAIEILVAVLLAVTIGYCVLVNRKLAQLRSDQSELKSIVRDLHQATDQASHAIIGLRESAATADETLGRQLERVKVLDKKLSESIGRGDALLSKLAGLPRASEMRSPRAEQPSEPVNPAPPQNNHSTAEINPASRQRQFGLGLLNAQRRAMTPKSGTDEVAA